MIWAIVSSQSCFCWLCRASPSLAAKNMINLILVLTICLMSMCRVISHVVGSGCLLWLLSSLGKTLLDFALLHFVLQGQTCLLLKVSLDFLLLLSTLLWGKWHLFLMLVLEVLVDLHKSTQLQLFWHQWLGHRHGLLWYWMVCLKINRNHSVIFEISPKNCILDSLVDYEGYSISSKGFAHSSRYNGHLN